MSYGLYLSADGAYAQTRRLEVVANNVANADTVGFKRELAVFQARYAEQTARGYDSPGSGSINDMGGGVMVAQTKTDFSAGPTKRTNGPTDLAIDGEGFLMVKKGDQQYLTRRGQSPAHGARQPGYAAELCRAVGERVADRHRSFQRPIRDYARRPGTPGRGRAGLGDCPARIAGGPSEGRRKSLSSAGPDPTRPGKRTPRGRRAIWKWPP